MKNNQVNDIYVKITSYVASRGVDYILEPSETVEQCCVGISKETLLSLSDDDFAKSLYFKFLDRPPLRSDIESIKMRLSSGKTTRSDEIKRFFNSEEYAKKQIHVKVIK